MDIASLPAPLETRIAERYAAVIGRCREAGVPVHDDAGVAERIRRMLLVSDFAGEVLMRQPERLDASGLDWLGGGGDIAARAAQLQLPEDEAGCMRVLRRFRDAEAMRLVFRDANGLDTLADTLGATSTLYEALLQRALEWSEQRLRQRFGEARNADGQVQRLVVLGFGKLGGNELNFSSDVDLVLAFPESGQSDGPRPLDNGEYFTRLARQLVRLLAEPTEQGIVARVDLRLRPFGSAGRLALPFPAMEQYYQREGRDWERYAWIKARPVAGDPTAGRELLAMLRPFVYRRYLDYTAFAGLRDMKARIDAEVARKDLSENLKQGPGGIREIEFVVQLEQLIRGGRDPALRVHGLLPALEICESRGYIPGRRAGRLRQSWTFLRHLENRVQMLRDAQTHDMPDDPVQRARLALGLGYADWPALAAELSRHRDAVTEEFQAVLVPDAGVQAEAPARERALWQAAAEQGLEAERLRESGFLDAASADALNTLSRAASVRAMSARSRARLERLMPQLIIAASETRAPDLCLRRLVRLVQAVARRSSYLSLLEEQPRARQRLARVFAEHAFLAESVIAQPLLLDDVLDPRMDQLPLRRADIAAEIARALTALDERDAEGELERLNELKASLSFRLGLSFRDGRADAVACARRLAALAAEMVGAVLALAERELIAQHGRLPGGEGSGFCVLGYGSLGGEELGFASDLDLVFVYDGARARGDSDGERPLDGTRWYQRLAQRVMHWLSALTRAGRLYEVDTRLRPDGSKGLLVTSLDAFAAYQRERAWTWEHQALLRARPVAGDAGLGDRLRQVRRDVLTRPRRPEGVRAEVTAMRRRWREQRDRSNDSHLDLKQGPGALLDIEFLLQGLLLMHAPTYPELLERTANAGLIEACRDSGLLEVTQARRLAAAHADLLTRALACTLDARPRIEERDEDLASHSHAVRDTARALGFDFGAAGDASAASGDVVSPGAA